LRKGQGIEQESIDGAEDGGVGADAQGESNHRDRRESWPLDDAAQTVTEVTKERLHGFLQPERSPNRQLAIAMLTEANSERSQKGLLLPGISKVK
jgi:hypothetical protein